MKRRRVIATLSVISLTGCSANSKRESHTVCELVVRSWDDEAHEVTVQIRTDDEDTVFGESVELEPVEETDSGVGNPDGRAWENPAEEPGRYSVRARVDGGEWETLSLAEYFEERGQVEIEVGDDGQLAFLTGGCTSSTGTPDE